MCTWSYSHHHHFPPCPRPIEMVVNYNYCAFATHDPSTSMTIPCDAALFGDDAALLNQIDYNDPCATGGCLWSPDCNKGVCRVAMLGGRWVCCQCGGGGNELTHCQHVMRACPDTFCYHDCCDGCRPDRGGSSASSASASSAGNSGRGSSRRRQR